jgi:AbiU2
MSYQSAEELLAKHVRDMGDHLGQVYNAMSNELSWLHVKWNLYRQLYATSPERVEILNRAASHFFGVLRRALVDDIAMHVARLTDPATIRGRQNLTIRRLPPLVPDALKAETKDLASAAMKACDSVRVWRNRRIAHIDLEWVTSHDPLPGVTFGQLGAAVESLCAVLHRLEQHYWQTSTMYADVITPSGDAESLVYFLWKGLLDEDRRRQRIRSGQPLPEDFKETP